MVTLGFEVIALLIFWKFADFKRFKLWIPIIFTGIFLRFLEHYIIIDWLKLWEISGSKNARLWVPISAELTIWPVGAYLFIQYLPDSKRFLYGMLWVAGSLFYLQMLIWLDVFSMKKNWYYLISCVVLSLHYFIIYKVWIWIYIESRK